MSASRCPMCGKASAERYRPFCSKRCADLDLGKWLGGEYRIETEEAAAVEDLLSPESRDDER